MKLPLYRPNAVCSVALALALNLFCSAQESPASPNRPVKGSIGGSSIALHVVSTMDVPSEAGGGFTVPAKCDGDGDLYIRRSVANRPLLEPVVKISSEGKRVALFDPAAFSELALSRADAYSVASDGGLYQIAQSGILKPRTYVLRFAADGSPALPVRIDADFEVYAFAAFAGGNFLVSGVKRDFRDGKEQGHNFSAVFSADGRELAQISFANPSIKSANSATMATQDVNAKATPALDLSEAQAGANGNLYVMKRSSPALVYVIAPTGEIVKTIKIASPIAGGAPVGLNVSINRLAILFWDDASEKQSLVVADAQTGRRIAAYPVEGEIGPTFACYSANEDVFTFLRLEDGNALAVIRAEPQ